MIADLSIEVQLKILKELQSRFQEAGNICQETMYYCPRSCGPHWTWDCQSCVGLFEHFNIQIYNPEKRRLLCPCTCVPDVAIPCLDEYIEMLEKKENR